MHQMFEMNALLLLLIATAVSAQLLVPELYPEDYPFEDYSISGFGDPCQGLCGANAECKSTDSGPSCSCLPGYYGHPFTGCKIEEDSNQCNTNNDCSDDQACIQRKCSNPCVGVCGKKTQCKVTNHYPTCACKPGYEGDAFTQCKPLGFVHDKLPTTIVEMRKQLKEIGTKKFSLVSKETSRDHASMYCQAMNMELAAIENEEENNQVLSLIAKDMTYWTSGYYLDDQLHYYWMTGSKVVYSNWRRGEPNGPTHCITVTTEGWANQKCSSYRPFICQYYEL